MLWAAGVGGKGGIADEQHATEHAGIPCQMISVASGFTLASMTGDSHPLATGD